MSLNTIPATLTDATILINFFQSGGEAALNAYVNSQKVVITDVVRDEITSDLSYPQDQAISDLISSGNIIVIDTNLGTQISNGLPYKSNMGEQSMIEAYNDPANGQYNFTIASDDTKILPNSGATCKITRTA
jgi:hypothetical protein